MSDKYDDDYRKTEKAVASGVVKGILAVIALLIGISALIGLCTGLSSY